MLGSKRSSNGLKFSMKTTLVAVPFQEWIQVTKKKKQHNQKQSPTDVTPMKTGGIVRDPEKTNQNNQRQKQRTNRATEKTVTNRNHAAQSNSTTELSDLSVTTMIEEDDEAIM